MAEWVLLGRCQGWKGLKHLNCIFTYLGKKYLTVILFSLDGAISLLKHETWPSSFLVATYFGIFVHMIMVCTALGRSIVACTLWTFGRNGRHPPVPRV